MMETDSPAAERWGGRPRKETASNQRRPRRRAPHCRLLALGDPADESAGASLSHGQAGFSIARADALGSITGRVAAHQTSAIPANREPALATCAFDKPHMIFGLRRTNSTRKRAMPVRIRYWPTMEPT